MRSDLDRYRATIPSVPAGIDRPLWSVMIPTYHCADYLRETLASILAQDPGEAFMQIAVVDDGSTLDDPESVVEEMGRGRVEFYRQPQNVGYIENFATCLRKSRGYLIHLLHGDDAVLDGFYAKMRTLFDRYPEIGAGFCRHVFMDDDSNWLRFSPLEQSESGILQDWLEKVAVENPLQTPSIVVKREVYEKLGGFDRRIFSCGEDWEMWVRIAAEYPIAYETELLALYRDRSNSLTKRSIRTGQNIRDVREATDIFRAYLPEKNADEFYRKARKSCALWGIDFAWRTLVNGDTTTAIAQIREALKCSFSREILFQIALLAVKFGKREIKQWSRRLVSFDSRAPKEAGKC